MRQVHNMYTMNQFQYHSVTTVYTHSGQLSDTTLAISFCCWPLIARKGHKFLARSLRKYRHDVSDIPTGVDDV